MKKTFLMLAVMTLGFNTFAQTTAPVEPSAYVVCVGVEQPVQIIVGLDGANAVLGASFLELDPTTGEVVGGFDFNLSNLTSDDANINIDGGLDMPDGTKLAIDVKSTYSKEESYTDPDTGTVINYSLYEGLANFIINGATDTIKVACYNE